MFPARLTDGYRSFLGGRFNDERTRYETLAEKGQKPEIMVIGCCDSRVAPEVIFDAGAGELFVVRNVANLVPPYEGITQHYHGTSAALEFAVQSLRVKHIVVLGHALCGGVSAFANSADPLSPGDFIGKWMQQIAPVVERTVPPGENPGMYIRQLELATVEHSLNNLMTFPCVRILAERGQLQLHGAYFGVATGVLMVRDPATGEFHPVTESPLSLD
ncbi:MAG: carbonate dehydratase [Bordetella sp. SCN 67-23]|nr:carbonic anhydrase [Burkholderiales bacterium]ODS76687.1 MAG: carbonate dehydratase [Bordetella sp. SCN 67-23]OJW93809.1 MAG: carbonate dehydratase [Burkholderiales bacterium 67-32]